MISKIARRPQHSYLIWTQSPSIALAHPGKICKIGITFTRNENIFILISITVVQQKLKEQAYQHKVTHFLSIFTRSSFPLL